MTALPAGQGPVPPPIRRSVSQPALLFVCLGNICRSPLAEAAFRRRAAEAGLACTADSAGTGNWHVGSPPDPRAVAEAARHGIDITPYRGRQVAKADFTRFTHILALDTQNLADLTRLTPPGATASLALLLDHVPGRYGQPVADPYWGEAEDFMRTWEEVDEAARALVTLLKR
nr:low molecular weight protein-tyrosine-phosphatase [Novosphingobium flavum]